MCGTLEGITFSFLLLAISLALFILCLYYNMCVRDLEYALCYSVPVPYNFFAQ